MVREIERDKMTAHKMVDLACDECGNYYDNPHGSAGFARETAKADGWAYRKGKDICYKCLHPEEHD